MEGWQTATIHLFQVFFCFAVGSAIGSFLNVVVHRLPLGMSLTHPPSRCPACGIGIRPTDNVPVLGWLRIAGKCRDCGTAVSPRYPLVEAGVGLLAVLLAYLEFFSGGVNLPGHSPRFLFRVVTLQGPELELLATLLYHFFLLCSLIAVSLIESDGFEPPRRLVGVSLAVGLLAPLLAPGIHAVPLATVLPPWLSANPWLAGLANTMTGLIAGLLLGAMLGFENRRAKPDVSPNRGWSTVRAITFSIVMVGTFLGWQAAVTTTVIFLGLRLLVFAAAYRFPAIRQFPLSGWATTAALVQIVFWKSITLAMPGAGL